MRAAATRVSHRAWSAAVYLFKLSIVVDVFVFVKQFGRQHHADGSRGEIFEGAPDAGHDEQSLPRMVEQHLAPLSAVVDDDMERAAHGDEQLPETASPYVFLNPSTGEPYKLHQFYYLHKKILKKARLPWVAFRDLQSQCMEVGI